MATDDDLAALDVLDAAISDPQRDDDDALDAYEELIALAARDTASAPALSKTAQLLTKHFARFPHVHANVLDALLALCARARPQAARIHTLRALIHLARTLPPDARERVRTVVATLAATETSGVITRTMNELGKALRERKTSEKQQMTTTKGVKRDDAVKEKPRAVAAGDRAVVKDDDQREKAAAARQTVAASAGNEKSVLEEAGETRVKPPSRSQDLRGATSCSSQC